MVNGQDFGSPIHMFIFSAKKERSTNYFFETKMANFPSMCGSIILLTLRTQNSPESVTN